MLLPFLGRIKAERLTSEELAETIVSRLRGDYLKNPIVKVRIRQIYSHLYFIQGAIRRSGIYQIEGFPTLLELLTVSGGLSENHGTTAVIIRRARNRPTATGQATADDHQNPLTVGFDPEAVTSRPSETASGFEILKANLAGLLKGDFEQNLALEPGDIVTIPPSDLFFVAGEVMGPGSFPLRDGTTLRQAISMAQGMTPKASGRHGVIYREDGHGERLEIKVDIEAVMRGQSEDLHLIANDIVIIPNSRVKSATLPILAAFVGGLAWGVGGRLPGR